MLAVLYAFIHLHRSKQCLIMMMTRIMTQRQIMMKAILMMMAPVIPVMVQGKVATIIHHAVAVVAQEAANC